VRLPQESTSFGTGCRLPYLMIIGGQSHGLLRSRDRDAVAHLTIGTRPDATRFRSAGGAHGSRLRRFAV
jgi:hypothetical protein